MTDVQIYGNNACLMGSINTLQGDLKPQLGDGARSILSEIHSYFE